jgi:acetyl-CoA acetyltransferase
VSSVYVVDACRTPIGKVKGALAEIRPDHLAADILKALIARNSGLDVRRRGAARGAAAMCIGVGQGIATLWAAC